MALLFIFFFAFTAFGGHDFWQHPEIPCTTNEKASCLNSYPLRSGQGEVKLVAGVPKNLAYRLEVLKSAKKTISIQSFIFRGDQTGKAVADILKQKCSEGVDVKVVVDALPNWSYGPKTIALLLDLIQHGIQVEGLVFYPELVQNDLEVWAKRFHQKIWVIDSGLPNQIGFMGGTNIANEYFRIGSTTEFKWRDQDIVIKGDMVDDLDKAFMLSWNYYQNLNSKRSKALNPNTLWNLWRQLKGYVSLKKYLPNSLDQKVLPNASLSNWKTPLYSHFYLARPIFDEHYIAKVYEYLIESAKEQIIIENAYFIPEPEFIDLFRQKALDGVEIIIITNSRYSHDFTPLFEVSRHNYKDILEVNQELIALGKAPRIFLYEWEGKPIGEGNLHSKYIVVDETLVGIGSYNFDPGSKNFSSETFFVMEEPESALELKIQTIQEDIPRSRAITWEEALSYHQDSTFWQRLKRRFYHFFRKYM